LVERANGKFRAHTSAVESLRVLVHCTLRWPTTTTTLSFATHPRRQMTGKTHLPEAVGWRPSRWLRPGFGGKGCETWTRRRDGGYIEIPGERKRERETGDKRTDAATAAPTEGGPVSRETTSPGSSTRARWAERDERGKRRGLIRVAAEERTGPRCNQSGCVIGAPREWG